MKTAKGLFSRLTLMFLGLSAACSPGLPPGATPTARPSLWQGAIPIGEILAHPEAYRGREVLIVAYYRGWDLFGEVGHGPPLTRSDVAVADATGAIYIAPASENAFPSSPPLPPWDPASTEVLLRWRGTVERTPAGMLYLRVVEGEVVEGLPVDVLLRIRRQGGLAGFDQELMITEQGTLYLLDRRIRRHGRVRIDPLEVRQVLGKLSSLPGAAYGTPVPDGFVYALSFWGGDKLRTLVLYDPGAGQTPAAVQEVLEAIRPWFGMDATPVREAVDALAERWGIPREEIEVVSYDRVPQSWPDTRMGCPEPGAGYAPASTSGYRVFLKARGRSYELHVNQEGTQVTFCGP